MHNQVGVTRVYTYLPHGITRHIRRDGGTDSGGGWFSDGLTSLCSVTVDMPNCTAFCRERTGYNCWDGVDPPNALNYYLKCYEVVTDLPLNHLRMAFLSQIGSTDIDPIIPEMSLGNYSFCISIKLIFLHLCFNEYTSKNNTSWHILV